VTSDPKRLTVVGATDLERTLLQAARRRDAFARADRAHGGGAGDLGRGGRDRGGACRGRCARGGCRSACGDDNEDDGAGRLDSRRRGRGGGGRGGCCGSSGLAAHAARPGEQARAGRCRRATPAAAPIAEPAPDIITEKRIEKIRHRRRRRRRPAISGIRSRSSTPRARP
jgi:hypothetical protein